MPSTGLKFSTVNRTCWSNANPIPSVKTQKTQRASLDSSVGVGRDSGWKSQSRIEWNHLQRWMADSGQVLSGTWEMTSLREGEEILCWH